MVTDIACMDCVMILANDDSSGILDPEQHWDRMAAYQVPGHYAVPNYDGEQFFSRIPCGVCGETLAGDRLDITWIKA